MLVLDDGVAFAHSRRHWQPNSTLNAGVCKNSSGGAYAPWQNKRCVPMQVSQGLRVLMGSTLGQQRSTCTPAHPHARARVLGGYATIEKGKRTTYIVELSTPEY